MKKYFYSTTILICFVIAAQTEAQRKKRMKHADVTMHDEQSHHHTQKHMRSIKISTNIHDKSLEYAHWTGTYTPNTFLVKVNDTEIPLHGTKNCTIAGDVLTIRFDYMFMNGYRKGAKEVTYRLTSDTQKVEISFDWNSKWRIIVNNAEPIHIKEVPFSA